MGIGDAALFHLLVFCAPPPTVLAVATWSSIYFLYGAGIYSTTLCFVHTDHSANATMALSSALLRQWYFSFCVDRRDGILLFAVLLTFTLSTFAIRRAVNRIKFHPCEGEEALRCQWWPQGMVVIMLRCGDSCWRMSRSEQRVPTPAHDLWPTLPSASIAMWFMIYDIAIR